jgi:hypothetical protein
MNVCSCGIVITSAELEVIEALILPSLRGRCRAHLHPALVERFSASAPKIPRRLT